MAARPSRDFDGDGRADVAVYRPSTGTWFWLNSSANNATFGARGWGVEAEGDVPVVADFDGDGIIDPAVYRPSSGTWLILESHASFATWTWFGWGAAGDTPMPGDFDGDGKADGAVYRAATGTWYVRPSSGAAQWSVVFGTSGDVPLSGDFDGDGIADIAVYRPSTGTWFWLKSSTTPKALDYHGWGMPAQGDVPVPGDYDGDGKTDLCVFRPGPGTWFVLESHAAFTTSTWFGFGTVGDLPAAADFDGDGKADAAVYRSTTNTWYVRPSSGAAWNVVFGAMGDIPLNRNSVGEVAKPTITPAGGTFATAQTVTLAAMAGATIRYTTDGSDPTAGSAAYTGPLTINEDMTLSVRAFLDGWLPSPSAAALFVFDRQSPTITAVPVPAPNAAGWNNSRVTVMFHCADNGSGIATCPAPAEVTTDGPGQAVQGTAVDRATNTTTTTVVVNMDHVAPIVHLISPADGFVATASEVTVTGTVSDALSGLAQVTCNGTVVAVQAGGAVSCVVTLRPGLNPIVLQATDAAGNGASTGIRVRAIAAVRSTLQIAPSQSALTIGEARVVQLLDQDGQAVAGASWTVSEPLCLAVEVADGRPTVTALAVGTATLTATLGGLTATAQVTVNDAMTAPAGTVRWTLAPLPGTLVRGVPFVAHRVDPSVPDLYLLEGTTSGARVLRSVFADGTPGDTWAVPPNASMALADRRGGVILKSDTGLLGLPAAEGTPWGYDFLSSGLRVVVGQSPEGVVYIADGRTLVGIDGATGAVRFRYQAPGVNEVVDLDSNAFSAGPAVVQGPVVGYDGAVYAFAITQSVTWSERKPVASDRKLSVVRVTPDGGGSVSQIDEDAAVGSMLDYETLVPDPRGGVHVEWSNHGSKTHQRISMDGATVAVSGSLPFDRIGDGVGFDDAGVAYDLDTYGVKFSPPVTGTLVTALTGGGVAITNGEALWQTDEAGTVIRETPMPGAGATLAARITIPMGNGSGISYLGGALWMVYSDGISLLEGEDLADYPSVYPDLDGAPQPGMAKAIETAVHLMTPWWPEVNQQADRDLIRTAIESQLNEAFRGYVVHFTFDERHTSLDATRRHVWVQAVFGPDPGQTSTITKYSNVYPRNLENALLTALACSPRAIDLASCAAEKGTSRAALVTALGRGIGATIAHELGHQIGLAFSQDREATPSDCYDAKSAVHVEHFFGPLRWSDEAKAQMAKVLLRR